MPILQGAEAPTRPGGPGGDVEAPAAVQEVPQDKHMEEFFQEVTAIKVSVGPAFDEELLQGCWKESHLVRLVQYMVSGQALLLPAHEGGPWHARSP